MAFDVRVTRVHELNLSATDVQWMLAEFEFQMDMLKHTSDGPLYDLDYIINEATRRHPKAGALKSFIAFCGEQYPYYNSMPNLIRSVRAQLPGYYLSDLVS